MPPPEPSTFPFTFPFKDIQTKIPKTPLPRNLFGKEMYSYPSSSPVTPHPFFFLKIPFFEIDLRLRKRPDPHVDLPM